MYVQNSSSLSYSAPDDLVQNSTATASADSLHKTNPLAYLSERAVMIFQSATAAMPTEEKEALTEELSIIGKAAAFASVNGFESINERNVISHYFGNLSGIVSDEQIRKMIYAKLDKNEIQANTFFERYAHELSGPLQGINIKV